MKMSVIKVGHLPHLRTIRHKINRRVPNTERQLNTKQYESNCRTLNSFSFFPEWRLARPFLAFFIFYFQVNFHSILIVVCSFEKFLKIQFMVIVILHIFWLNKIVHSYERWMMILLLFYDFHLILCIHTYCRTIWRVSFDATENNTVQIRMNDDMDFIHFSMGMEWLLPIASKN